jgi:DNA-binding transcriptional ArsR family regulator
MKTVAMKKTEPLLDYPRVRSSVLVFRSVNHKFRQKILNLLDEHTNMTVTDLYVKLRCEQSVASQHLAILRRAGVVTADRHGKHILYSVNYKRLNQLNKIAEELSGTRTVGI